MSDPKLRDEPGRLAALHRYEVLDTPREEPFDRITDLIRTVLEIPICAVSLIAEDRQWIKSCSGQPLDDTTAREISFCTHTIQEREAFYIPDTKLDPRFVENPLVTGAPFIRSYLGAPLSTPDGYNVGALCAIDMVPRAYRPDQLQILQSFASLVVDELELRRIAQVDHLTGAATRRGFCVELGTAMSRFQRAGHPTALILLDIDHFKHINDTYGHPVGDRVLKSVAAALVGQLRRGDTVGRLGGEEFGILLQDTERHPALETAERLRASLESLAIAHEPAFGVTASFGVSNLDAQISDIQHWLARADEAMYAAKRAGRNRSCVADALHAMA